MEPQNRREAIIRVLRAAGNLGAAAAGGGVWLNHRSRRPAEPSPEAVHTHFQAPANAALPEMAVVQGNDPAKLARRAIEELGGMRRFVGRGDVVVVKPNAAWDRTMEQAANTNPLIVAEICPALPRCRCAPRHRLGRNHQ